MNYHTENDGCKVKTNEEQTEGMEPNKNFISRFGYIKTLVIVAIAGVVMSILGRC